LNQNTHNKLVSFIWRIADDCLRDVYVRGKYRDVILPMVVLRRLDTLLEPTKDAVLEEVRYRKEEMKSLELDDEPLREASTYVFYNTSQWTLKKIYSAATNKQQISLANIEDYLDGFSSNVKEIVESKSRRNGSMCQDCANHAENFGYCMSFTGSLTRYKSVSY
jgi:type I restriction enzyme M protein